MDDKLAKVAERAIATAIKRGADQVAASITRARFIEINQRARQVETLEASTSRGLSLALYVDGRYSSNSTCLLDPDEVDGFIDRTLSMTRRLAVDPFRGLPDPDLYGPTGGVDLDMADSAYDALDMDRRRQLVAEAEASALGAGDAVISVTADMTSQDTESLQLHSNGFSGERRMTRFMLGASVTAKEDGDRRPEDGWWTVARHLGDLPTAASVGEEAGRRALARIGSRKVDSKPMTLVVENRAAGKLIRSLLAPLSGATLQQRRSCFEDTIGQQVGSGLMTMIDDPLRPRSLGARTFDGEGLAARRRPIFTAGRLESYFINVYYGRKLGLDPTSGTTSNLILEPGDRSLEELIAGVDEGVLVTSFLGGNSKSATGDFSYGVSGFYIRGGACEHPVSEMNITGSHTTLWHSLEAVGDDPYPYSALSLPSMLFSGVQFSGA